MKSKLIIFLGRMPAPARLAVFKKAAAGRSQSEQIQAYRQGLRYLTTVHFSTDAADPAQAGRRFFESPDHAGIRFDAWADQILQSSHTGWHADLVYENILRGAVFRLPGKAGRGRFIAGYGENDDGFILDLTRIWSDGRAAALHAERVAEEAREQKAEQTAQIRIEEIAAELQTVRRTFLDLRRSIRRVFPAIRHSPSILQALESELKTQLNRRRALTEEARQLRENPWAMFEPR